jgi:chromosome segregation ATPase
MSESNRDVQVEVRAPTTRTPTSAPTTPTQTTDQWLDATLDQIFLSPRVIDERAYEELSGSLRTLMKDAAGQSRALIQTTGEVKLLGNQLREATQQLQAKVETAVRVIPTLDQRMKQAETLLEVTGKDLTDKVASLQEAATRALPIERERIATQLRAEAAGIMDTVLREQLAHVRAQVAAEIETLEKDIHARLAALLAPLEQARHSLSTTIENYEQRAAVVRQHLEGDEARLAALVAGMDDSLAAASRHADSAAALVQRVSASAARAEIAQQTLESTVSEAGVRLGAGITEAERRAETVTRRLETEMEVVNSALNALHAEVEAARNVKAVVTSGPSAPAPSSPPTPSPFPVPPLPDIETLEKLGRWLQQMIEQGDKIGRGLAVLVQRAGK